MWINKLWLAVVVAISVALIESICCPGLAGPPEKKDSPAPTDAEKTLKKSMLDDARKVFEQNLLRFQSGAGPKDVELMYNWSTRWLDVEFDLAVDAAGKTDALKAHLNRMKDLEKSATALAKIGEGRESDAIASRYYRTQAELWLARGRTK